MSLIRFDSSSARGPSAKALHGLTDWVHGSLAVVAGGQFDFEDFSPFLGASETSTTTNPLPTGGTQITSLGGDPTVSIVTTERYGVIKMTEAAASNECVGLAREVWYDLQDSGVTVVGARVQQNADADTPVSFVGLFDGSSPHAVLSSGAVASGSNQDTIGLRWNNDETIDIVSVDDGTLTVLQDNIGVTVERDSGFNNYVLRIEKMTSSTYRLIPFINEVRGTAVNVAATSLPENPMRPVVAGTVSATTAPELDVDWILNGQK